MPVYDFAVIGGGLVGLSTALALGGRRPEARILVLEKEAGWARHQSGHNSGVIHSGIYYRPGGLRARMCRDGNRSMVEFCRRHGIPHEVCGKLIVATRPGELGRLEDLYQRGLQNGLDLARLAPQEVREIEPHVRCLAAIQVPSAGITDYSLVAVKYAELVREQGADLRLQVRVAGIQERPGTYILESDAGDFETRSVINCAGLHSDRLARLGRVNPGARIVPFRGEYFQLRAERCHLVRSLIYPVPRPDFPFLGVHLTRTIGGGVHAGPNAVLSFKREGYRKSDFDWRDFWDIVSYSGFWRMALRNASEGFREWVRSLSKSLFLRSVQQLIPEIQAQDLEPAHPGVRAQALGPDGRLVDDFLLVRRGRALHVCNAPSPAATASLEIGREVAARLGSGEC